MSAVGAGSSRVLVVAWTADLAGCVVWPSANSGESSDGGAEGRLSVVVLVVVLEPEGVLLVVVVDRVVVFTW